MSIFALSIPAVSALAQSKVEPEHHHDSHVTLMPTSYHDSHADTEVNLEPRYYPSFNASTTTTTISPEQQAYEDKKAQYLEEIRVQGLCVEWAETALSAGWQPEDLPRLMRIMHRESRCIPTACGETDSPHIRKCRDWGLMQINDHSWKRIIREQGYHIEDMWDPYSNLKFARWLFDYSLGRNGDGWVPWKFPPK